ncbi:bifunctional demethylmenaquinone methyltransferase/2-methoxy-6-polyprenyl-1,4-benzoquinol methylase UbiE [Marinilabiliaceae bacterium JC017]|nr:bifunctional demethylmenaquinone methyltransferase/2-methoxy-6-polyprenyl-1,4-benzoquinol methylase UbiE [Marinilabiliaceae bacterium JC017]
MSVKPYKTSERTKKQQVATMFNNIAPRYDLLNHLLSLGIDKRWRRRAINLLRELKNPVILDVATGTGDLALLAHHMLKCDITGVDISSEMLSVAQQKIKKQSVQDAVQVQLGDSEHLPFDDASFDAVMVAFGVRNFENLNKGLSEMQRVLKPGGKMVILEFSRPAFFPFKQLYFFYFKRVLPFIGGLISKDRAAYTYLPESVLNFPDGERFDAELKRVELKPVTRLKQTLGIATIYLAEKKQ